MKNSQKYVFILLFSVALLIVVFWSAQAADVVLPRFHVQSPYNTETENISIFDAKDGNYYVFLPSYANMRQVTVSLPEQNRFSLGDIDLLEGMNCSGFELETPYDFAVNEQIVATFWFYRSANVATMYIDTATGSMEKVHRDKNHKENISVSLYTVDGAVTYLGKDNILKGRGNTTWNFEKRPYSLILSDEQDLLGMGTATNWVLLANAMDETNLNNTLVFDLAQQVGLPWTPDYEYVDLYLNGQYNGLYLLTEKVETGSNRTNIDTDQGDFLCKFERSKRWDSLANPFETQFGRTVEINTPEILSQQEKDRVITLVNQMEQIILSGADLSCEANIDLDSWVRRYLIDEISANEDSDNLSSYFYYTNGVFYAGPVWDYDLTFGYSRNIHTPNMFAAYKTIVPDIQTAPYYRALCNNDSFTRRTKDIFISEFMPILENMLHGGIHDATVRIACASQMNHLRWEKMFHSQESWNNSVGRTADDLCTYLEHRIAFLRSIWIDNIPYHTVCFKLSANEAYGSIAVKEGDCLPRDYVDLTNTSWVDERTGKPFDINQPVMTDLILLKQTAENNTPNVALSTGEYITLLSIAILFILLVGLAILDIVQRRKERSTSDEHKRTTVSS